MHSSLYDLGVLLAFALTLVCLVRRLPLQNVLLAGCIIGGIAWSLDALKTFLPGVGAQPKPSWTLPVLWIVLIINSRIVSRLIFRPWRQSRFYGFGVIGVALTLATTLQFALQRDFDFRSIDWRNLIFSTLTALLSLVFGTPALISKSPDAFQHPIIPPLHHSGSITEPEERCGKAANK